MGGTGRGLRVTPAAATDSRDAQIPEPGPDVEARMDEPAEGLADEGALQSVKRRHSYSGGETFEGGNP
jgi:hypothetical protein